MKTLFLTTFLACIALSSFSQLRKINECVIEKGVLKVVSVDYDPATGDRTIVVNGKRTGFYELYPEDGKEYAGKTQWFIKNEPVTFKGKKYNKYGLPRILGVAEVSRAGEFEGVGIYVEAGAAPEKVEIIYVPVRSGCEFQPYEVDLPTCATVDVKPDKAEITEGDNVTFSSTVTGASGTIEYKWRAVRGKIVGDDKGKSVTVSSAGVYREVVVVLAVTVKGKECKTTFRNGAAAVKKKPAAVN